MEVELTLADIDLVFNYINTNTKYHDMECALHSLEGEELERVETLNNLMEKFAAYFRDYAIALDKDEFDYECYFENYNSYIEHNGVIIKSRYLFGLGSTFNITKVNSEYNEKLLIKATDILNPQILEEAIEAKKLKMQQDKNFKVSYPKDWDGNNSDEFTTYIDIE